MGRGLVVPEHGGTLFREIFLSRNGAPVNIVYHSWNGDTAAFWQISSTIKSYLIHEIWPIGCQESPVWARDL